MEIYSLDYTACTAHEHMVHRHAKNKNNKVVNLRAEDLVSLCGGIDIVSWR